MKTFSGLIFIFFASLASATDPGGTAVLSLVQVEDRLDLFCTETE